MPERTDVRAARNPGRFPGGVLLPPDTAPLKDPIATMPPPQRVVMPLDQHEGSPAIACVSEGERVLRGQLIAKAGSPVSANLHASISGTVTGIAPHPSARGGHDGLAVSIESDGRDEAFDHGAADPEFTLVPPSVLRQQVAEAGVVGQGGAAFPTAIKLAAAVETRLSTLIINGAECDPYISCDEATLREHAGDVLRGAQIMLHILQIHRCIVAIEEHEQEALDATDKAIADLGDDRITLARVPAVYPEGGERQLIQVLSGEEVPSDGLPMDIGYLCHNVGTARAVSRAVLSGERVTSRVVTVGGPCIEAPANVEVRLGTLVRDLVEFCGGYQGSVERLIVGGAMMGAALESDEIPIEKGSNAVTALDAGTARPLAEHLPCIRCGDCAESCPASLLPQQLYWYSRANELDRAVRFNLFDCIECGCCDLACPSHIPLTEYFRGAKHALRRREADRVRAAHARRRYDARNERLAQEAVRKAERLERRKQAVADTDPEIGPGEAAAVIKAAVERARARRAARQREDSSS